MTLLVGQQEGHPACKNVGCWFVSGDALAGALHVLASVITTTSITLSYNKIQNGDILVPASPVPPGKWPGENESIDKRFVMWQLVEQEIKRELDQEKQSADAYDGINSDAENDEEEYEAWKVRELKRIKRDREERET